MAGLPEGAGGTVGGMSLGFPGTRLTAELNPAAQVRSPMAIKITGSFQLKQR